MSQCLPSVWPAAHKAYRTFSPCPKDCESSQQITPECDPWNKKFSSCSSKQYEVSKLSLNSFSEVKFNVDPDD